MVFQLSDIREIGIACVGVTPVALVLRNRPFDDMFRNLLNRNHGVCG